MKVKTLLATFICAMGISSLSNANDKVESIYSAQQYQQVCKGKSEGAEVSFPYKGIIWNGTCKTQFFPNNAKDLTGTEAELNSVCTSDPKARSVTIQDKTIKGKCALGYAPPTPKA